LCRKFEGHKKNFEGEIFFVKNRIWKIFIYFGSILKVNFIKKFEAFAGQLNFERNERDNTFFFCQNK
jgi:hypothetical protein